MSNILFDENDEDYENDPYDGTDGLGVAIDTNKYRYTSTVAFDRALGAHELKWDELEQAIREELELGGDESTLVSTVRTWLVDQVRIRPDDDIFSRVIKYGGNTYITQPVLPKRPRTDDK